MDIIKIVIADDHALIREGLSQLLGLDESIEIVGFAANGEEAMKAIDEKNPDVVLLDISMPKLNGIETVRKLQDRGESTKIIMLTMHDEKEYIIETMNLGVDGYILKDANPNTLIEGIKTVYNGGKYIDKKIEDILENKSGELMEESDFEKLQSLTKRETEILLLIADGMTNKEIADKLYISEKTIKNHVTNLFKKLSIKDRVQATIFVYQNNLKN